MACLKLCVKKLSSPIFSEVAEWVACHMELNVNVSSTGTKAVPVLDS